ncbi:MAG: NADH-dependent [FeFe] hydrogenase, group A6 [Firmicutes bacterium]|nr:NADH-dependent [FeFe] hydrogenase, group A6 [Bacillota bacterium]MDH7496221.1 NADH-dependent [FeFe] hydrogenase, group A6 [Bacillota bacterium]
MPHVTVDGQKVEINGEKNILEVVRKAGIELPTFCYHSELSVYGACRMCSVEVEGMGLVAGCSTPPADGMVIRTNTERTLRLRRMVIELLLANHHRDCTTCEKNGMCKLQSLAYQLGVRKVRFGEREEMLPIDEGNPSVVRDPNKCILCGDCVRVCSEIQGVGVLDFAGRGSRTSVSPAFGRKLSQVECVYCGQCVAVCPTGALTGKSEVEAVWSALHDPSKTVVAQVAPAVRVALGEVFGGKPGEIGTGKVVAALKKLGFKKVFDTVFAADLTAVEECHEFLERLGKGENLPQFTSCCPGWVKFMEQYYPDMLPNLSTCKSPQQMFGSVIKRFYSKELGVRPEDVFVVSIMPCTAKKFEATRPEFASEGGIREVDAVLSTTELGMLLKQAGTVFDELEEEGFDQPFGLTTGGGVIFGVTGGVAEAVLRAAAGRLGVDPGGIEFQEVRGFDGTREATVRLGDAEISVAVVHGLANARRLVEAVRRREVCYNLVEVMACPGGCVGGGGQPYPNDVPARKARGKGLYRADRTMQLRSPSENLAVAKLYEKHLGGPGSTAAHEALHTAYGPRRRITGDMRINGAAPGALDVSVCVGTGCYLRGSYDVIDTFTRLAEDDEFMGRVNLKATFCLEHCDRGVSIKVGDEIITGVTPENAQRVFHDQVAARLTKEPCRACRS